MSAAGSPTGAQPSEEELRAAYEAEIKKIRVEQVLLEHVVTMINLGMRRTGLAPGTESERDAGQVRLAIESIRRLVPLLEQVAPSQVGPIRDALSQLQLAFVRIGGQPAAEGAAETAPAGGEAPPPGGATPPADPPPPGGGTPPGGATPPGGGTPPAAEDGPPAEPQPGQAGPAQRSGRLWVPGQ